MSSPKRGTGCASPAAARRDAQQSKGRYACWACGKTIPAGEELVRRRRRDGRWDGYGVYHPTCEPPK